MTNDRLAASGAVPSGPGVVIVLSSYNGATYIAQQIESLRAQTHEDWRLLVRDDGSSDGTAEIVEAFAARDPRIVLARDAHGNLGPAASFGVLLERAVEAGARYVALADQDDVWHPEKLAHELQALASREAEVGTDTPLLVHSDLTVVQQDLRVIHPSFLEFQGLSHAVIKAPLRMLLVQNYVTGCTVLVNRALLHAALPLPRHAVMHDWWLALCAAAAGELLYVSRPMVLYRQHGANTLGAQGLRQACLNVLRRPFLWWRRSDTLFMAAVRQGCELARRVEERRVSATPAVQAMLREYCEAFSGRGAWFRLRTVRRYRIEPQSLVPFHVFHYVRVAFASGRTRMSEAQ